MQKVLVAFFALAVPTIAFADAASEVAQLTSAKRAECVQAVARLSLRGDEALDALEAAAADEAKVPRIKEVLKVALATKATWAALEKHPKLLELVKPEVEKARAAAKPCFQEGILTIGGGLTPRGEAKVHFAWADVEPFGGFAVPVALELVGSKKAVTRAHGIKVIERLGLDAIWSEVEKLQTDEEKFKLSGGDFMATETVGSLAKQTMGSKSPKERFSDHCEDPIDRLIGMTAGSDLVNGIRGSSKAYDAKDADTWWSEALPAWEKFFELLGDSDKLSPDARKKWNGWLKEHRAR